MGIHATRVFGQLKIDVRHQLVVVHALQVIGHSSGNLETVLQPLKDDIFNPEKEYADEGHQQRLYVHLVHLGVPGVERVALPFRRRVREYLEEGKEVEVLGDWLQHRRGSGGVQFEEGLHRLDVLFDDGENRSENGADESDRRCVQLVEEGICR